MSAFYKDIFIQHSADGGETWSDPYDLINEEVLIEPDLLPFTEGVFPHLARRVDNKVHLIYQQDFRPGMSAIGDGDEPSVNFINYVGLEVTEFGIEPSATTDVEVKNTLVLAPNPASDEVRVFYELTERQTVNLDIMNVYGQLVQTHQDLTGFSGLNANSIQLDRLNQGIHILHLHVGEQSFSKKLSVQR